MNADQARYTDYWDAYTASASKCKPPVASGAPQQGGNRYATSTKTMMTRRNVYGDSGMSKEATAKAKASNPNPKGKNV